MPPSSWSLDRTTALSGAEPGAGASPVGASSHAKRVRTGGVCLAASGGGHVRQLLDLAPVWSEYEHFFVTEDTALGRSIRGQHPVSFVDHVALGQARLGAPFKMAWRALKNFFQSAAIILRRRPAVVLTTGAGAVYFAVLWARLLGAKVVLVESFARFDHPSMFFRIARPIAHHKVVQSPALSDFAPDAEVFDPLRILEGERPAKEPLVFATVGATLPFDRLAQTVAKAKADGEIPERVVLQTGVGGVRPEGLETVETLSFDEVNETLEKADIVVCHGGTGSLITALRQGCRVIAIPRLFERGEHYDDHQAEITAAFEARGLIAVARSPEDFSEALRRARAATPVRATTDPQDLIAHLRRLFSQTPSLARARRA